MGSHEAEKAEQERQRAEQERQRAEQERYKKQQEEEKRKRAEEERKQKEEENKILDQIKKNNEAEAEKLRLQIQIERERRKREQEEWEREQEEKRIKEEQERKEKNKKDINKFRSEQDIGNFLVLVERFLDEPYFLIDTLKALNEEKIITNYDALKDKTGGKIQIIKQAVSENKFEPELLRKLILILFCNEKNGGNCNKLFEELLQKKDINELIFDILLKYSKNFQNDIKFGNAKIYRQFVEYSIKVNKYIESLDYRSNDYIQLKLLNEMKEEIFKSDNIIKIEFGKFEDYTYVFESVNEIIKFEKNLRKKLVILQKAFWESFYNYYINNENEKTKLEKLVDLYELLLSYVDLGKDDTEYKDILAENIHKLVKEKIKNTIDVSKQLELLFEVDRYYAHPSDLRDPYIFNSINIFDLTDKKDIEYFQKKNIEKIYEKEKVNKKGKIEKHCKEFLKVIIDKIEQIEDFICV